MGDPIAKLVEASHFVIWIKQLVQLEHCTIICSSPAQHLPELQGYIRNPSGTEFLEHIPEPEGCEREGIKDQSL